MPRRTSRKSSTSVPVFKKQTQTPQKETRQSSSPSVLSTVGQGVSLGAGAAIGSSMIHGALGSIMDSKVPDEKPVEKSKCLDIFKQYHECAVNTNDLDLCKPYVDFYTQCVQGNQGFN